jgi:hypothetical protein
VTPARPWSGSRGDSSRSRSPPLAALLLTPSGHRGAWLLFLLAFVFAVWSAFLFVALSREPGRRTTTVRRGRVATLHTLSFLVGDREKHSVDFVFDQMWGWLTISVDGRLIIRRFITFSVRLRRVFDFRVGTGERHDVRIEKTRPLLVAFARPQPTRAFCDGVLVAEDDGVS